MIARVESKRESSEIFLHAGGGAVDAHVVGLVGIETLVAKNSQLPAYPLPDAKREAGRVKPFPVSPGANN